MKSKKLFLTLALAMSAAICVAPFAAVSANADEAQTYVQDFAEAETPADFAVTKSDSASTVGVEAVDENNVLKVVNASGATEIKLPVERENFVAEFDCTRAADANALYSSMSLKYRVAEDYSSANEVRVHSKQKGLQALSGDNYYTQDWVYANYTIWLQEATGQGVEHWHIKDMDTAALTNDEQQMHIFNYYYHELYIGETHTYRVQVTDNLLELYIDGEMFLRDIIETGEDGTGLALRVDGDCTMLFDNIKVYTPEAYAEKRIAELPDIQDEQTDEVVDGYVKALEAARAYGTKFVGTAFTSVSNYATLAEKEAKLEEYYGLTSSKKPQLTVAWVLEKNYVTEDKVQAPAAEAVDIDGNKLAVDIKVQFDGKTVRSENGAFTAVEAGEYTLIYTARDRNGNESSYTNKLTVAQGEVAPPTTTVVDDNGGEKTGNIVLPIVAGCLAAVAVAANVIVLVVRRKKQ